jgi:hypothetical protein
MQIAIPGVLGVLSFPAQPQAAKRSDASNAGHSRHSITPGEARSSLLATKSSVVSTA